ncbi:MAG: cytochrome c [Gemmatimonadales bacterium]|nr:cytochrome c [Gemmatimonadales bacterium]
MSGKQGVGTRSWILIALLGIAACGGKEASPPAAGGTPAASAGGGLSAFQLEHGIGPVTDVVELPAAIDPAMAKQGQDVFEMKCAACHQMEQRFVGPALGDVVERRSPAFIMNFILNPQENIEEHPVGKELLAQFMSFMPNQGVTREEARAILEYLRTK